MLKLVFPFQADKLPDRQRASAFGILSGVASASFVCGTLAVRFLSTSSTFQVYPLISRLDQCYLISSSEFDSLDKYFQVAAFVSMLAVAYMRIFLEESMPDDGDGLARPILKEGPDFIQNNGDEPSNIRVFKKIPSVRDLVCFLRSR